MNSPKGWQNMIDQKSLTLMYQSHYHAGFPAPAIRDVGFRVHSQHEEDGILHFIFSLIGTTQKKCVEICGGDGIECNTANLIVNHRWLGLLCDGDEANIARAVAYYANHPDTKWWPPAIVRAWVTRGNVNNLIQDHGFDGEIDLLSLDIDGVDYWIWSEISCISPRVVVLEFNHLLGPDLSVTIPYSDGFVPEYTEFGTEYAGASLGAFVKLGRRKGYRLVGTNAIASNAFFVRDDIECRWLPEIEPSGCFGHPRAQFGMKTGYPRIKDRPWIEV